MSVKKAITDVLLRLLDNEEISDEEKALARDYLTSLATTPALLAPDDEVGFRENIPRVIGDHTIYQVSHFRPAGRNNRNLSPGAYVIATTGVGSEDFGTYWVTYFPAGPDNERWLITAGRYAGTRPAAELALAERVRAERYPKEVTLSASTEAGGGA